MVEQFMPFDNQQQDQGGATPINMASPKADLLDKIQPGLIVDKVFHRLLGEVELEGRWVKVAALQHRALTENGAWDIATLMTTVSSQNVSLSKLKDGEIRARALNIARAAQCMCLRNWKEYGIKGTDQLIFVHQIVFSNTFITLKQPEGEGIRRLIGNTISGEINAMQDEQSQGMSLFRR